MESQISWPKVPLHELQMMREGAVFFRCPKCGPNARHRQEPGRTHAYRKYVCVGCGRTVETGYGG